MCQVYILLCANGEYYVGSTTNLAMRLKEHTSADSRVFRGAKFTKTNYPVELVYTEDYVTEHKARIRERQLHKWSHAKKEALIRGDIDKLKDLSRTKSREVLSTGI